MMADAQDRTPVAPAAENAAQAPKGGFAASIVEIFADPFKVFARIDAGLAWWKPFVLVCAVAMVLAYLMLPLQLRLVQLNPRGVSAEQLQKMVEGASRFAPLGIILVPIIMIVVYLIVALVVHIVVNVISSRSSFTKTLSLISFCGIITIVEQVIGTVVLRMRGTESVESAADLKFSLSLAPLVGSGTGLLNAVLQSLSIFQIWYYVVLVLGIAAIFRISRKAAVIPVLPIWIISVIMVWIGGRFGGGMG
jgi:hypothetical protein